ESAQPCPPPSRTAFLGRRRDPFGVREATRRPRTGLETRLPSQPSRRPPPPRRSRQDPGRVAARDPRALRRKPFRRPHGDDSGRKGNGRSLSRAVSRFPRSPRRRRPLAGALRRRLRLPPARRNGERTRRLPATPPSAAAPPGRTRELTPW